MQQLAGRHPAMNRTHCIAFFILQFADSAEISELKDETTKVHSVHPGSHPLSLLGWLKLLPGCLESLSGWLEFLPG